MNKFEKLLGLSAAMLVFPLALLGAALALIPLRRINALAAARQSDRAG